MLFVYLGFVILTLRNVEYHFNIKYSNNAIIMLKIRIY